MQSIKTERKITSALDFEKSCLCFPQGPHRNKKDVYAQRSELEEVDHKRHGDDAEHGGNNVDEACVFAVVPVEVGHLRDCGGAWCGGGKKADEQNGSSIAHPGI